MIRRCVWLLCIFAPVGAMAQAYWQQEVNYKIAVTLHDQQHTLSATEEIEYINHSPDQLPFIYFHLWPNAYKNNQTALAQQLLRSKKTNFYFAKPDQRGYITGLDFKVNGQPVKVEADPKHPDICRLYLNTPLLPGQRITITTPFTVKLPDSFSRLGHVGQSYQISQWYPKPAVYDRRGWHPMPYLDQGEFYSEFGKFEVRITLPANYTVGATGVLQNPEERERMDKLAAETADKTQFPSDLTFPASSSATKTLHYVQDNIHDFAWFADKRFNVLKSQVVLPESNRRVTTWLLFLNKDAERWVKSLSAINDAVTYYSRWVGEYPYEHATAVDGALSAGSGMEYPMVTVTDPDAIVHEVGHNWFYGILASNERDYAWMDEGINSYYESRVGELKDPYYSQLAPLVKSPKLRRSFGLENIRANDLNLLMYQLTASRGLDQPVQLTAAAYTPANYGGIVYMKTGILFKYLAAYLGQEQFDRAMHTYYRQWQFRHPYPEDLQAVLEQVSGQKFDWFFYNLIQTTDKVDIVINTATVKGTEIAVSVKNESGFPVPIPVAALDATGKILELKWTKPVTNTAQLTFTQAAGATRVVVDPLKVVPELNRSNNEYKLTGGLPKLERIRPQLLAGIEQSARRQVYYLPVIGGNTYDKFMLGMAIYNSSLIRKKIDYTVLPMYSFSRNRFNGSGNINLNLLSDRFSQSIVLGLNAARFERFTKYEPSVTIHLKRATGFAPEQELRLAATHVSLPDRIAANGPDTYFDYTFAYTIPSVQYTFVHKNALQRVAAQATLDLFSVHRNFTGIAGKPVLGKLTLEYDRYYRKGRQVQARWFIGKFLGGNPHSYPAFWLGLSGSQDYKKETIFLDRSQRSQALTAFVHQTDNREGAFKSYLPVYADRWLSTVNLAADLPVTPLGLYTDLGLASFVEDQVTPGVPPGTQRTRTNFYYGTGLRLTAGNFLQLYFPVAGSNYAHHLPAGFKDFTHHIRFALNLNAYHPFKLLTEALK